MSFLDFWPARLAGKAAAFRYLKYADIPLQGSVGFRVRSDGTFVTGAADLVAGPGQIVAPGVLRGPVKVRGMKLRATLKPSPERFVLEELEADLGGPSLSAKAVMTVVGGLANVSSDIAIRDLPAKDIAKIWPIGVSSNGRDWVKKNITDGQVRLASVRLITQARLEDGTVNVSSVSGALDVEDLAIHYFRPLKPVRGVKARARFGPDLLDFKVTRGNLAGVRVEGGSVRISGFSSVTQQLAVNLSLDGPLTNYLQTLDHPKLGYISAIGLVPGTVGGAAQTRLTVNLPLIEALKFAQVDLRAKSEMSDVSVPAILMDQDLTVGRLALNLDLKGMTLTGDAKIADVPAKVILQRHFRDTKEFVALSRVQATLQPKELSRFGLDVDPVVTGPMVWDVSLTEREDRTKELTGSVDLSPATMSISFLNWSKPPGEAGNARFFIQLDPKKPPNLERFELTGGGLKVAGTARFGVADGWPLVSARIETFTLGQTNLKATLKRSPTGASAIAITGEVFDAGPLMEPTEPDPEPKGPKATQALAVTASIDRVLLGKGRVLPRLSGRASYDGRRWRDLDISTQLDAGKDASITIATAKGRQSILIRSNDAGVLLRRLKIVDSIKGGRLFVGGDRSFTTANDPWSGKALIKDFQLVKAPILAQVLTLASLTGIGNTLRGEGIKFSRLEVPFSYDGDIVTIKGARSVGSQLGLTGDGEVDLGQDSIRFKGTIVPAYTLNSLLSNIPIIREIFTGSSKAGSGVFAVNYGVSGKTEKPKVKVNPLSVLAPGFLRNLVEVMTSGEPGKDVKPEAPPDD